METLVNRIRDGLEAGLYPSERAVSTSIVVPILRALGWDDSDPSQVIPEYTNPIGRVDYALSAKSNTPAVFVEVKRVGQSADADRQLFEYAFHEGAQIAILTDGRVWNFYLPGQHGSYQDRRVYQLDLVERETAEILTRFKRYLDRSRIASGEALADAQNDYRASASKREAEQTLPKAWAQILAEPDGLLMELVRERTEALCGHKPSDASLEQFIRGRSGVNVSFDSARPSKLRTTKPSDTSPQLEPHPLVTQVETSNPARNRWRVGKDEGVERNGADAFAAVLSALFRIYPERQDRMAAAVRTRGRNNIARTVMEIYPSRPEIAERNHRPLGSGWFVGTNESTATKVRIVSQAVSAAGLVMGKDVDFEI